MFIFVRFYFMESLFRSLYTLRRPEVTTSLAEILRGLRPEVLVCVHLGAQASHTRRKLASRNAPQVPCTHLPASPLIFYNPVSPLLILHSWVYATQGTGCPLRDRERGRRRGSQNGAHSHDKEHLQAPCLAPQVTSVGAVPVYHREKNPQGRPCLYQLLPFN